MQPQHARWPERRSNCACTPACRATRKSRARTGDDADFTADANQPQCGSNPADRFGIGWAVRISTPAADALGPQRRAMCSSGLRVDFCIVEDDAINISRRLSRNHVILAVALHRDGISIERVAPTAAALPTRGEHIANAHLA